MRFLLFLLPLIVFSACEGNTAQRKLDRGTDFVPDANRIYFKNVKITGYASEDVEEGLTVYRHRDLTASDARLQPSIVDNWLDSKAALQFDVKNDGGFEAYAGEVEAKHDTHGWLPLDLKTTNGLTELKFHLAASRPLRIKLGEEFVNAFPSAEATSAAYAIVTDYLNLVGG